MKEELHDPRLEALSDLTNRSYRQTLFLYHLLDDDFEKLKALEQQIKNCFYPSCPADKKTVDYVMSLTPKMDKYNYCEKSFE